MNNKELENILFGKYSDYKCNDVTKQLIKTNPKFYQILVNGIKEGKVSGFPEELWDKIRNLNIRSATNLEDAFKEGFTIGSCTVASKYLSFTFPNCEIAGGINKFLVGTKNSQDGSHTWTICKNKIYDTTFMLIIDANYQSEFGYVQENIYNPNFDAMYVSAKEFANDLELNKGKQR